MNPKNSEKIFAVEYAQELLKIAAGDLASTHVLLEGFRRNAGRAENVFYAAQQVIEKSLKAVLCKCALPVPFTHDLGFLAGRLPEKTKPFFDHTIAHLSQFATSRRYEEGRLTLDIEEAEDAVKMAEAILRWAEGI